MVRSTCQCQFLNVLWERISLKGGYLMRQEKFQKIISALKCHGQQQRQVDKALSGPTGNLGGAAVWRRCAAMNRRRDA